MKAFLSIVVIFSFTITAGTCLTCENCTTHDGTNCQGSPISCDASVKSCASLFVEVTSREGSYSMVVKSCAIISFSSFKYTVTIDDTHVVVAAEICETDNCNNNIPVVPTRNLTENGVVCPFCFKEGLDLCTSDGEMKCTGLETKCIRYTGKIYQNNKGFIDASYQGCATPSACSTSPTPVPGTTVTCS